MLHQGVKTIAAGADVVRPHHRGIVMLCYHRVGARTQATEIDLPPELFAAQIVEISGRATTIGRALVELDGSAPPTGRDIVVTFDDGTADFADEVLPILVAHRVPAVLYVATRFIDEAMPFPHGGRPLSWSALREAASTGLVTVGSHTHSHVLLDRCKAEVVTDELDRSIDLIGEHVGYRPADFAYPKALGGNREAAAAVEERFRSASLAGTRPNFYGATDPLRLSRSPIQRSDGMRWFRHKIRGGMAFEDGLRRVAGRFRYAGASS